MGSSGSEIRNWFGSNGSALAEMAWKQDKVLSRRSKKVVMFLDGKEVEGSCYTSRKRAFEGRSAPQSN